MLASSNTMPVAERSHSRSNPRNWNDCWTTFGSPTSEWPGIGLGSDAITPSATTPVGWQSGNGRKYVSDVSLPMAADDSPSTVAIEDRLEQVGRYSRFVKLGLGIIVGAFLLSVVGRLPANLESIPSAVNAILLPLIFVGMGLLLFGIGMHLHLMHLNLVKQLRKAQSQEHRPTDQDA